MKKLFVWFVSAALLAGAPMAGAAQDQATEDDIFAALFPPELIMQHRRAIDLTDEQRDAISRIIQDTQGEVVRLQWELLDDMQELSATLERGQVDLDRALDQMDTVLDREKRIKQAHLEMLIRIKNRLSPAQQAALEELRVPAGEGGS